MVFKKDFQPLVEKRHGTSPLVVQRIGQDGFVYVPTLKGRIEGWYPWRFERYVPKDIPLSDYL